MSEQSIFNLKASDETVHEQLAAQGVVLDLGCGQGMCGQCKVKLLEGEFYYNQDIVALLYPDEIAACCAVPSTDMMVGI